jgi:hypothetical protein
MMVTNFLILNSPEKLFFEVCFSRHPIQGDSKFHCNSYGGCWGNHLDQMITLFIIVIVLGGLRPEFVVEQIVEAQLSDSDSSTGNKSDTSPPHILRRFCSIRTAVRWVLRNVIGNGKLSRYTPWRHMGGEEI